MGWDAFSSAQYNYDTESFIDPKYDKIFAEANDLVKQKAGTVDGLLRRGGLDCSACCKMLEEATGESCYDDEGWSAEKVMKLSESADWRIPYSNEDEWAYWSAKYFLETCAKAGLSIRFSY